VSRVLGSASATTAADPFGPGDPVEVARLVRRALAAAGAKALDVTALLVVAAQPVDHAALRRLTRRALGPHGAALAPVAVPGRAATHAGRVAEAVEVAIGFRDDHPAGQPTGTPGHAARSVVMAVALGPGSSATALCVGDSTRS